MCRREPPSCITIFWQAFSLLSRYRGPADRCYWLIQLSATGFDSAFFHLSHMWSWLAPGFLCLVTVVYSCPNVRVGVEYPCRRFFMRASREPRTGYKFGFRASEEHEGVMHREATVDDILESLGRHTQLADTLSMREARDPTEEGEDLFDSRVGSLGSPFVVRGS